MRRLWPGCFRHLRFFFSLSFWRLLSLWRLGFPLPINGWSQIPVLLLELSVSATLCAYLAIMIFFRRCLTIFTLCLWLCRFKRHWRCYWPYGTGAAGDLLSHEVDFVHSVLRLGIPDRCTCTGQNILLQDGRDIPDTWNTIFNYDRKGCTVTFDCSMNSAIVSTGWEPIKTNPFRYAKRKLGSSCRIKRGRT